MDSVTDIALLKAHLRARLKRRRAAMPPAERAAASRLAARAALRGLDPAPGTGIAAFWPLGSEIDPRPLMTALEARGARLALPCVVAPESPLVFRAWRPGDRLVPAGMGVMQPADDAPRIRPDVVLVPLLGFDRAGNRLGYGGGYYDRTLAVLRASGRPVTVAGFGFACQEQARLPHDLTDQRLDLMITECGTCRMPPSGTIPARGD